MGSSKDLKLVVTRYGKEIDAIMDVPNDLGYMKPSPSRGEYNLCESPSVQYVNQVYSTPITDGCASVMYSCNPDLGEKHATWRDRHQFDFHIDIGELDKNINVGVWVLFKISNPDGHAALGNLEVIEERSLTGEELAHVEKKEKRWHQHMKEKQIETQQVYESAK